MSLNLSVLPDVVPDKNAVTIAHVRAYVIDTKKLAQEASTATDSHTRRDGHWINGTDEWPIANPMSYYEKYKARRSTWGKDVVGSVVAVACRSFDPCPYPCPCPYRRPYRPC